MRRMRRINVPYSMTVYEDTLPCPPNEAITLITGTRTMWVCRSSAFKTLLSLILPQPGEWGHDQAEFGPRNAR